MQPELTWAELPPRMSDPGGAEPPRAASAFGRHIVGFVLVATPAFAAATTGSARRWSVVVAALHVLGCSRSRRRALVASVPVGLCLVPAVGAAGALASGIGAVAVAVLLPAATADRRSSSLRSGPVAAAVMVAGTVWARGRGEWWLVVVAVVAGLVGDQLNRRAGATSRLLDGLDRAILTFARVVSGVITGVLGLLLVVVPWAVHRLVGWDGLWFPRATMSRWVAVLDRTDEPRRMWDPDPLRLATTGRRRLHRVALVAAWVLVVGMVSGAGAWAHEAWSEHRRNAAAALAASPWWPDLSDALDIAYGHSTLTAWSGVELRDARFPDMNIEDGRRRTWQPPAAACRTARVWMFGGSTLFGQGQRDEHTIASVLAKAAWRQGWRLEIENHGVPADTSWMELRRLEAELARGRHGPDLVVFYGGANDYRVQIQLNGEGRGGELLFANDLDSEVLPDVQADRERLASIVDLTRRGPQMAPTRRRTLSAEAVGEFAAVGYAAVVDDASRLLDDRGVRSLRVYQPARITRSRPVRGERPEHPADEAYQGLVERAFRAKLPDGVLDLHASLDTTRQPVYFDEVHTNELGARLVAEAMLPAVLRALAGSTAGGVEPCR